MSSMYKKRKVGAKYTAIMGGAGGGQAYTGAGGRAVRRNPAKRSLKNSFRYKNMVKREYPFVAQYQDFNLACFSGQAGGLNLYASGSTAGQGVPVAPASLNIGTTWNINFNFTLSQLNAIIYDSGQVARGSYTLGLANYSEYTSLYDEFKIDKVEMLLYFNGNSSSLGTTGGHVSLPMIACVHDYDDSNGTALTTMQQYASYRTLQLGNQSGGPPCKITVKPKIQAVVQTVAGTAIGIPMTGWIDTLTPTAEHFGLKMWYINTEVGTAGVQTTYVGDIQIFTKVFFRCRGTR